MRWSMVAARIACCPQAAAQQKPLSGSGLRKTRVCQNPDLILFHTHALDIHTNVCFFACERQSLCSIACQLRRSQCTLTVVSWRIVSVSIHVLPLSEFVQGAFFRTVFFRTQDVISLCETLLSRKPTLVIARSVAMCKDHARERQTDVPGSVDVPSARHQSHQLLGQRTCAKNFRVALRRHDVAMSHHNTAALCAERPWARPCRRQPAGCKHSP